MPIHTSGSRNRKPLAVCVAASLALVSPLAMAATWTANTCDQGYINSGPMTGSLRYAAANAASGDTLDPTGLTCSTISSKTGAVARASELIYAPVTHTVTSCGDTGASGAPGELRYEVAHAASGDTIDMSGLTCGSITLYNGAISVTQNDLTLNGPGRSKLVITGAYAYHAYEHDRIIKHSGAGTLAINNVSIAYGRLSASSGNAAGGCVYSTGNVSLYRSGVYNCNAYASAAGGKAQGGGVFAKGTLTLKYTVVNKNSATQSASAGAYGGGIYATGSTDILESTISGNTAGKTHGFGGGVWAYTSLTVIASTISGNNAQDNGGGIYNHRFFKTGNYTTTIENSTISGNNAHYHAGGLELSMGTVKIYNSTIALNTAGRGRTGTTPPFTYYAPGVSTDDANGPMAVTLQSTLIANNTYGSTEYDLSVPNRSSTTVTFSGANDLVRATFAAVPSGTIKISCPLLGPLRNNGGTTLSHALLSHSPGIDQGSNPLTLSYDQRGSPFARQSGSASDIGAYEVQQNDVIFNNGFDGCPLLF